MAAIEQLSHVIRHRPQRALTTVSMSNGKKNPTRNPSIKPLIIYWITNCGSTPQRSSPHCLTITIELDESNVMGLLATHRGSDQWLVDDTITIVVDPVPTCFERRTIGALGFVRGAVAIVVEVVVADVDAAALLIFGRMSPKTLDGCHLRCFERAPRTQSNWGRYRGPSPARHDRSAIVHLGTGLRGVSVVSTCGTRWSAPATYISLLRALRAGVSLRHTEAGNPRFFGVELARWFVSLSTKKAFICGSAVGFLIRVFSAALLRFAPLGAPVFLP